MLPWSILHTVEAGSGETSSERLASIGLRSHHMDFDIEWDFASGSREKRTPGNRGRPQLDASHAVTETFRHHSWPESVCFDACREWLHNVESLRHACTRTEGHPTQRSIHMMEGEESSRAIPTNFVKALAADTFEMLGDSGHNQLKVLPRIIPLNCSKQWCIIPP